MEVREAGGMVQPASVRSACQRMQLPADVQRAKDDEAGAGAHHRLRNEEYHPGEHADHQRGGGVFDPVPGTDFRLEAGGTLAKLGGGHGEGFLLLTGPESLEGIALRHFGSP